MEESVAIRIELFGGPRVRVGATVIDYFPTRHCASLLALIALRPDRPRSRVELSEALWPDEDPEVSRNRLRTALHSLRRAIPAGDDLILANNEAIWLRNGAGCSIDTDAFDRLLIEAHKTEDADRRIDYLVRAIELYSGPLAPKLYADEVNEARNRYEAEAAAALRQLSQLLAERDSGRAVEYAQRSIVINPLSLQGGTSYITTSMTRLSFIGQALH